MANQCLGYFGHGGTRKSLAAVMVMLLPMLLFCLIEGRAEAQGTAAANTTASGTKTNERRAEREESLKQIAARLSQSTGVQVLVDSRLSRQMLAFSPDTVTVKTLDDYLARLIRRLPPGSAAMKIYLPAFAETQRITPNAVAQLAWAQRDLQRDLLGKLAPDTVYIQGKTLSAAEAEPFITTLGLKPVYILSQRQETPPGVSPDDGDDPADPSNLLTAMNKYLKGVTDEIMKQVGVADMKDIPNGKYAVTLPGDDGSLQTFTVEVGNTEDGGKRIIFKSSDPPEE